MKAEAFVPASPPPPENKAGMNPARLAGWAMMVIWSLLLLAIIRYVITGFDPGFYAKYGPKILSGVVVTIQIVALSLFFGAIISIPVALGRMSKNRLFSIPAYCFVYFFRGTPLLAQAFLIYYGVGSFVGFFKDIGLWWFFREAFYCVVLSFSLNTAAYQAEILRGAIQNIPRGQREAGQTLGLSRPVIFRKIILPQAMIVALRPYGNEVVLMIKGSAIASIVTVYDLMGETGRAFSRTYDFQLYLWAAFFYLVMVEIVRNVWNVLEQRLTRHLVR